MAKLYRYNLNLYRYNRSGIGQKGFLNRNFGASSYSICFLPSHMKSPSRLPPLTSFLKISCSARVSGFQFQIGYLQLVFERGKPYNSLLALLIFSQLHMDLFGWIWLILFCDWWLGGYAVHMGRRLLSDVHRASPVLFETGFWDMMIISGPSGPLLLSLPFPWHVRRIPGRGRHPVPLWNKQCKT